MKNFSVPTDCHHLTPRPKSNKKECQSDSSDSSTLNKNFTSNPNALVNRIERLISKFTTHTVLGSLGEELLIAYLKAQGWYKVVNVYEKQLGDVSGVHPKTGEIVRFEVKAAKRGISGRWQFCLNKGKKTACKHSDFLFFLAIDEDGVIYRYLAPTCLFAGISQFSLSSHPSSYKGKLSAFRLRSETIDIDQANEIYQLGAKQ